MRIKHQNKKANVSRKPAVVRLLETEHKELLQQANAKGISLSMHIYSHLPIHKATTQEQAHEH